jgi:ABC-type uncharacterized transport system ATPase subunit
MTNISGDSVALESVAGAIPVQADRTDHEVVPLLKVNKFTKHFGDVWANTDVDLDIRPGEVHALVGENGAGKSTMLKMIYGVYTPDSGTMEVDGKPVRPGNPAEARALGIGMVFQDLRLVPALTVVENVALAMPNGLLLRKEQLAKQIDAASEKHGLSVHARSKVRHLSIGERQRVEILKVLMTGARLVILDEPTSVLAPQEVDALFGVVRHLRDQGFGIVIVTHKLNEVRAIADRVTVLRAGRTVLEGVSPADYTNDELIEAMVGRAVSDLVADRAPRDADGSDIVPALELIDVRSKGDAGHEALKGISFAVYPGELVGVAGVAGSGQRELCEVALGLRSTTSGSVRVCGKLTTSPQDAIGAGAVSVPEDPVADSVVSRLTVLEHMVLDGRRFPKRRLGLDWGSVKTRTDKADVDLGLRMAPKHRRVSELSGGNIQRVLLTRELSLDSTLVIAAYPSRGLDIANARRTQEILLERKTASAGVLMISEDLDELMSIADRIVVMHDGHLSGVLNADEFDRQRIGQLMLGGAE